MMRCFFSMILMSLVAVFAQAQADLPFNVEKLTAFEQPWALAFLPDGRMLVTKQRGSIFLVTRVGNQSRPLRCGPDVHYGRQGGLGDIALHPYRPSELRRT